MRGIDNRYYLCTSQWFWTFVVIGAFPRAAGCLKCVRQLRTWVNLWSVYTLAGLKSKWKTCLAREYPTARQAKNKGKKNIIILILVIASRYTEVKLLASGHNERLWNSQELNLISFINQVLSMRYPSFWSKVVLCNFWQCQSRLFPCYKDPWVMFCSGGNL